jgi:hypothetical protein
MHRRADQKDKKHVNKTGWVLYAYSLIHQPFSSKGYTPFPLHIMEIQQSFRLIRDQSSKHNRKDVQNIR